MRYCLKLGELRYHFIGSEPNKSTLVAHLITIVGCTEDSDAFAVVLHDVPLVLDLVAADHQLEVVLV